jgi:RNA recognition motif-containing protein
VFVGNLPLETTKQTLTRLFKKFGKIDSIRFRGAARPDMKTTKKVAVITRKVHEKHQRIIAYVRFKSNSFK